MNRKNVPFVIIGAICVVLFSSVYFFNWKNDGGLVITSGGPVSEAAAAIGATAEQSKRIKVHVTGAVENPGVYELDEGSRVVDAVEAAGGMLADADDVRINLASYVKDAEQVWVPSRDELEPGTDADLPDASDSGLVNINTAGEAELTTLPGIGPVTAQNIIKYRETKGGFSSIDEIKNVTRIGQKTFDKIKDLITN